MDELDGWLAEGLTNKLRLATDEDLGRPSVSLSLPLVSSLPPPASPTYLRPHTYIHTYIHTCIHTFYMPPDHTAQLSTWGRGEEEEGQANQEASPGIVSMLAPPSSIHLHK